MLTVLLNLGVLIIMAGKVSTRKVTERRVTARPAGTTAPISVDAIIRGSNHCNHSSNTNNKNNDKNNDKRCPDAVREDLADHMAQVLTGKKKLAPTPEHLDLEAKIKKAWAEGWRGHESKAVKARDELFGEPLLKVEIGGYGAEEKDADGNVVKGADGKVKRKYYGPGRVLVDRLDELAAAEGYTVS